MILSPNQINEKFNEFFNPDADNFIAFPESSDAAAEKWGEFVYQVCENVQPQSSTLQPAKEAFINTFNQMSPVIQNGFTIFQLSFNSFTEILSQGMVTSGFNGIAPPTDLPLGFDGLINNNPSIEALNFSTTLYNWLKTGTAINIITGVTINWV